MSTRGAEDFGLFFNETRPRLLRALAVLADDLADAEDALQEAYVRAAARWERLDEPEAWVRTVARNLPRDGFRRRKVRERARRRLGPPDARPGPDPTSVAVVSALRALPPEQRDALALHYLLDMTVDQVAQELGRPTGTVKAQLARGRARMAMLLQPEGAP